MPKTIGTWSASRYKTFKGCAMRAYFEYVEKIKFAVPAHLQKIFDRGTRSHYVGQLVLQGSAATIDDTYRKVADKAGPVTQKELDLWWAWADHLYDLREQGAVAEERWGFTRELRPVDFFRGPKVWLRAVTDVHIVGQDTLYVIDFKTGRVYDEHEEQAEIYAVAGKAMFPKVRNVEVEFWYLDQGPGRGIAEYEYDEQDLDGLRGKWIEQGTQVTDATKFPATPDLTGCKRCPFSKFKKLPNGSRGPCQYAVED